MTEIDDYRRLLVKIAIVENRSVGTAACLARRFIITVFCGVSLLKTVVTKFTLRQNVHSGVDGDVQ